MHSILHVDREKISAKKGLMVVSAIAAAGLLEMLFGDPALFAIGALIAAYFVSRVGVHKHGRQR